MADPRILSGVDDRIDDVRSVIATWDATAAIEGKSNKGAVEGRGIMNECWMSTCPTMTAEHCHQRAATQGNVDVAQCTRFRQEKRVQSQGLC